MSRRVHRTTLRPALPRFSWTLRTFDSNLVGGLPSQIFQAEFDLYPVHGPLIARVSSLPIVVADPKQTDSADQCIRSAIDHPHETHVPPVIFPEVVADLVRHRHHTPGSQGL